MSGQQRESIAFHYERPGAFFLPWFERWRSYSHGLYAAPGEDPATAQARKLQRAFDALRLEPGMEVLDMGCGWGSFLEYAGERGIRVHGITLSEEQHRFVERLIRERLLPCRVSRVDFLDLRPTRPFDGVVFRGSLEHVDDVRYVAAFLRAHLSPRARAWVASSCGPRSTSSRRDARGACIWSPVARRSRAAEARFGRAGHDSGRRC